MTIDVHYDYNKLSIVGVAKWRAAGGLQWSNQQNGNLGSIYSKFYRLFVTPSAPDAVKSVRCAFFFELLELIKTKITSLICATTVLDKNLDFRN